MFFQHFFDKEIGILRFLHLININALRRKEWIAALPAPHPFGMALVFLDHALCLLGLMLVVCRLGLVVLLLRPSLHLLHLPFGLALRTR